MTYTCVFYEETKNLAKLRLSNLRQTDKYTELKAYIIPVGNEFRVLRKIEISSPKKAAR